MNKEAYELGTKVAFLENIMPSDEVFQKAASEAGVDVEELKKAYIEKLSFLKNPAVAGGLAVGAGLLGAGMFGMGLPLALGMGIRGMMPTYMSPYHRRMREIQNYNLELSRDMQGQRAAYAPAPPMMAGAG